MLGGAALPDRGTGPPRLPGPPINTQAYLTHTTRGIFLFSPPPPIRGIFLKGGPGGAHSTGAWAEHRKQMYSTRMQILGLHCQGMYKKIEYYVKTACDKKS